MSSNDQIVIVDYFMGNHASIINILKYCGVTPIISSDKTVIAAASKLILPGVGSFSEAMKNLDQLDLTQTIKDFAHSGRPILGICLGMQIMFEKGEEGGDIAGLGFFKGRVQRFIQTDLKIPHVGFNNLICKKNSVLFHDLVDHPDYYFTHSYYATAEEESDVSAVCDYGIQFVASIEKKNIYATQFHPELSQKNGIKLFSNFINL